MALATFTFNGGTANTDLADPTSADSGSGYKLVTGNLGRYVSSPVKSGARSVWSNYGYYWNVGDSSGAALTDYSASYWIDAYFYVPTGKVPGSTTLLVGGAWATSSYAGLAITSDRRFALLRASDSTVQAQTATNVVPLDAWFRVAVRYTTGGVQEARIVTSSAGDATTADHVLTYNCDAAGYLAVGLPYDCYVDELTVQDGTSTGIPAGSTTHTATGSLTATASRTAAAFVDRVGGATSSTTATTTATGTVERVGATSSAVTAATTATATREAVDGSTATTTATITASADVTTPGAVSGDASATWTAAITAAAALAQAAAATLATTATITAEATVSTTQTAAATSTTTATITATLVNESETTPGTMRALSITGPTIQPVGAGASTIRVAVVGFNAATMTAVVSTEASEPTVGVPVFAGPDDPVALGLVDLGDAYVWFHDGTVFVSEG